MIKSIKIVSCDVCEKEISRGEEVPDDLGTIDVSLGVGPFDHKSNKVICSLNCMKSEIEQLLTTVDNWKRSQ